MTVPVETPIIKYIYTAPAILNFNFKVYLETDLEVRLIDVNNSVTILALNIDYTVALNPLLDGGTVNVTYVPPGGYGPPDVKLHIVRNLPLSQVTAWVNNTPFNMIILERDLDRAIMLIQELYVSLNGIFDTSQWRGNWATGLYYDTRDMVVGPDTNYYMATEPHTSGVFVNDLTASKWILYVDVAALVSIKDAAEAARVAAEVAATSAANDLVLTNADVVSTGNDVISTNVDVVSTAADAASAAADAISTAGDAAQTALDAVSTANDVILANKWAEEAENVPVVAGKFSALHWAAKAAGFVKDFITGTDTPASYVGQALKIVRVNAGETAVEFAAPTSASGFNIISKAIDYPILPADLVGYIGLIVLVDASAADRTITLPAPADYSGKTIQVIADVDPAGFSVITNKSGGTEWHTGVAKNDHIKVASNGTKETVLDHKESHYCRVYVDLDEPVAQGASAQIINISETTDIGEIGRASCRERV